MVISMNDTRLHIYLNDHLALMVGEIDLIARCESSNHELNLGESLRRMKPEVEHQMSIIRDLLTKTGGCEDRLKQGAAWFAEKLGRFKLNDSLLTYSELSRVVELEALTAAAQERIALWDTLDAVMADDKRLTGIVYSVIRDQSQEHLDELSAQRRDAALWAFA